MVYKIITIADIHFGAVDPKYTYEQLRVQFIQRLYPLNFEIIAICGDIFDARYMSNNPIIPYVQYFMDELVQLCRTKNATLVLISGTESHDNGQLSLFYHYLNDKTVDVRIVETIQFLDVKRLRILCIPEKYGLPEEEYKRVLFQSGGYDLCFLHGTIKGSIKGAEVATLNSTHAPVFSLRSFENCAGPILCGHYHIAQCYEQYIYYNGSPIRYQFGQEQEKGFLITLYEPDTRRHFTKLIPIHSYIYNTINIDHLVKEDPKKIVEYIKMIKERDGIDFIRVQFNDPNENMQVVRNYFRNVNNVKLQELNRKEKQNNQIEAQMNEKNQQYEYILDQNIDPYMKLVKYVNDLEGYDYISSEELINLLEGDF